MTPTSSTLRKDERVRHNYRFFDRLLHRLALGCAPVADMSFEMDQATVRADPAEIVRRRHVFVSGLARAGTTILMRQFYATGKFRSLTYQDMPFVLAPNLWRRLTLSSRREIESAERAHGDLLFVDGDSPESLDEVFWRIFAGHEYMKSTALQPHVPDDELVSKYVRYVNAILSASDPVQNRYLSKNNNNILRLGALRRAFPRALILIPFRDPLQHASSLHRQHVRFLQMQAQSPFITAYMSWLGHHEFGLGHRCFNFEGADNSKYVPDKPDYWLSLWCATYSWLERSIPSAAVFVCYEHLCNCPETWRRLANLAEISTDGVIHAAFTRSDWPVNDTFDERLARHAAAIYARLVSRAHDQLSREG